MGIDARMFVRLRGDERITPDQVLPLARELAAVIGPEHFLITKAWRDFGFGEKHHCLSIVPPATEEDVEYWEDKEAAKAIVGRTVWFQDGDPIVAQPDEQFVEVHLSTRFYGEGYARGDWPTIRMVAEWLELKFLGGEVWYGGDSSGVCAEHLDTAAREVLNRFYLDSGNTTYGLGFDAVFTREVGAEKSRPTCFCCEVPMRSNGGGAGRTFWWCVSCPTKAVTRSDEPGEVQWLSGHDDVMQADELHQAAKAKQGDECRT